MRQRIAARGLPCAICGHPIDYGLPPNLPGSFELDEILSRWKGGDPLDMGNVQPVHRACNQAKYRAERAESGAARRSKPPRVASSRAW